MSKKEKFERFKQDLENRAQLYVQSGTYEPRLNGVPLRRVDFNEFVQGIVDDLTEEFTVGVRQLWTESDIQIYEILHPNSNPISFEEDWRNEQELQKANKGLSDPK